MAGAPLARTLSQVWASVRAPGVAPPGVVRLTATIVGATLLFAAVLIGLGLRDHGQPGWHFYEARTGTYASAALLVASAVIAAGIAWRLHGRQGRRFWVATAVGFLFLAYDELGVFHEGVDKWLHRRFGWRDDHPVTDHIDTVIVALYGVVAVAWAYRYRETLLQLRWATRLATFAFAGFVAMETLDALANWTAVEESLKLLTEALIVVALLAAARDPGVYFSRL